MIADSRPTTYGPVKAEANAVSHADSYHVSDALEMRLDSNNLPVSNLSSLLRVLQAATREVGLNSAGTRQVFSQQAQPTLLVSTDTSGEGVVMRFRFADPVTSVSMDEVSRLAFDSFMVQFSDYLKGLPQKGLWGHSASGSQRQRLDSVVSRRMNQLRLELRRFQKVGLRFGGRAVLIEGDRMEIDFFDNLG